MERLVFHHPLYARESLGVLGEYVTLDAGTGAVHTAPGHGADDYHTGVRYGLEIYAPLDAGGHYNESVELFAGLKVWDANPKVEEALKERGRLWHREDFDHSYPHCWRCHNPVIFMATSQWFIAMDAKHLRERALKAIGETRWIPSWGEARIEGMIANRPDWCISRQRVWGVPIPAMDCTKCGTPVLTKALVDKAAAVFDVYGADAWYERPVEEFIPEGMTCASCGGKDFEREGNILDVWFDSGSSHEAVLPFREDHHWPADIYLEGSDQHRGWFHSSLLVGVGTRGRAPFNQVLTHGFVMDEHGRKMSKSLGNTVAPQDVIKQSGAEVLRLWVSMVDYRYDINIGKEVLARAVESYRKFRNVIRVLVANLYDFDPKNDSVPKARMGEIDRWVLAKYADAAEKIVKAYDDYDYPAIFQIANQFITVDLSAFYVDVTKDRMYTLRRQVRSAALRPDRDVHHRGGSRPPARADLVGDDGRVVAAAAGRARGVGAHGAVPARPRPVEGRRIARTVGASWPPSATRSTCSWKRSGRTRPSPRNLSARVVLERRRATRRSCLAEYRGLPADAVRRLGGDAAQPRQAVGPLEAVCRARADGTKCDRVLALSCRRSAPSRTARVCARAASKPWPSR